MQCSSVCSPSPYERWKPASSRRACRRDSRGRDTGSIAATAAAAGEEEVKIAETLEDDLENCRPGPLQKEARTRKSQLTLIDQSRDILVPTFRRIRTGHSIPILVSSPRACCVADLAFFCHRAYCERPSTSMSKPQALQALYVTVPYTGSV